MGPCDDLPAKPELLHWGTMRRDLVTRLCRASVNSAFKEHGVMCRLTATAFDENDPSVRTLNVTLIGYPTGDSPDIGMRGCRISKHVFASQVSTIRAKWD
ncbi:hypothetical protein AVEN_183556-1 [Araneus ventricosus]|uniref:Uncharacterized protein n=1 Tax=Araneus ventricosus TaxID=182803 RepID=A0A4Y2FFD6_ARAVE|nr:hypothetical protein AVEN_183556-1 [Araneus ventricosus]